MSDDADPSSKFPWRHLPEDIKNQVSARVRADRIARLRMERVLTFFYAQDRTCPSTVLTAEARVEIRRWGTPEYDPPAAAAALRQLFDRNFRLRPQPPPLLTHPPIPQHPPTPDEDDVNITPAEWAQVVTRIVRVRVVHGPRGNLRQGELMHLVEVLTDPVPGQGQLTILFGLPRYNAAWHSNRPRAWIQCSGFLSWQTFTRATGSLRQRVPLQPIPPQQAAMHMNQNTIQNMNLTQNQNTIQNIQNTHIQQESQVAANNPYLAFQSGVASSVLAAPRPTQHQLLRHTRKTRAPKRQPPRPPRPPDDGCADDAEWHYSWRLVVPVGSQPGQWPEHSAVELCEESMWSTMEDNFDTQDWVRNEVVRELQSLFVPLTAQDANWWTRFRGSWDFQGEEEDGGLLLGDNLNRRHLLYLEFLDNGNRITREPWAAGRHHITSVAIRYRGPARFRPRHPNRQQFLEHRLRPNQQSPVFRFS